MGTVDLTIHACTRKGTLLSRQTNSLHKIEHMKMMKKKGKFQWENKTTEKIYFRQTYKWQSCKENIFVDYLNQRIDFGGISFGCDQTINKMNVNHIRGFCSYHKHDC